MCEQLASRESEPFGADRRSVRQRDDVLQGLQPLLVQIRRVEEVLERIRRGEGTVGDLGVLERRLCEPVVLKGTCSDRTVSLVQPQAVRGALQGMGRELHLEVHAMPDRYPCYLLCRLGADWDAPDTVVEELHVSPRNDFFPDERFVILSRRGRSRTFLRLSIFRDRLRRRLAGTVRYALEDTCDRVLESAAKLVFGSAWYEDQRLPFHVSSVFGLTRFRWAVELVGFALGTDLYGVSTALRDCQRVLEFFENIYDNRPLARLLGQLARRRPSRLSRLEDAARRAFVRLNDCFAEFLGTTDALRGLGRCCLYQVVLAHFFDLAEVAPPAAWTPALEARIRRIEEGSGILACAVLDAIN